MKNKTSDFISGSKPRTVILREKTWRVEVSHSKAKRFLRRHRVAVIATLIVFFAGIAARYALVGFATTADFYPSSCLGNWENVQNALGKPDLAPDAPASAFTTLNAAVFGTSTAQMFCGNFSGDTSIAALTDKSFQGADLVLSWSFTFREELPAASTTTPNVQGGSGDGPVSGATPPADADDASSTPTDTSVSSTSDTTPGDISTQIAPTSTDEASSTQTSTTPVPVPAPAQAPPADSGDATDTSSPPPDTSSDASPTSWLTKLVGVAHADETSSVANDASTTELTVTSSAQEGTPSEPQSAPINVNTSMFQNIILPSSTANMILALVYSTDGVTWQLLVNIDSSNWQQRRYAIPIHSWQELQHLQVAFVGFGASSSPQVFLDAAGVEVSYVDTPENTMDIIPASDTIPEVPPSAAPVAPPPPVELPPVQALKQIFDPFAEQQCAVTPFSETVVLGGGGSFLLKLTPPAVGTSSQNASGTSFLYDVSIGSLPEGISTRIMPGSTGVDTIGIDTAANAVPGSYNVVVVYKERQRDGTVAPNFCQFNLVVTDPS